jgi:hypothetical protein
MSKGPGSPISPVNAACVQSAPEIGPTAGHVITPGIDDVLESLAAEEDRIKERHEQFEGREQTPAELEAWKHLFTQVQKEANKRLNAHSVHLFGCAPNARAFGAVFIGFDSENRRYEVMLGIPATERRNMELAGREAFVRSLIDMVVAGTLAKRQEYLRRGGLDS